MNVALFSRLVMIEQSLFGLPWVVATALLAWMAAPIGHGDEVALQLQEWGRWFWIVLAFTAARTAGMAFNRVIDCEIDAANPRTAQRALPRGEVTARQVRLLAVGSVLLFVLACAQLNRCCVFLSPVIVLLLWLYSYTKRYTYFCHFFLGSVHFFSPLFAWAAVTGSLNWPPVCIGAALWVSIAGSDILYALQDREFDRQHGLYSIPAVLGVRWSLWIARALHATAVLLLGLLGCFFDLGPFFWVCNCVIAALYIFFHRAMKETGEGPAFFYCNSVVALVFLCSIVGGFLWRG